MEKIFISFADSRLKTSAIRIKKQAIEMNIFDKIFILNEHDLDYQFKKKFKNNLLAGSRIFGYGCWKPQVILQLFNEIKEGDIVQYSDVGSHLNKNGIERLLEYFRITEQSEFGVLGFQAIKPIGRDFYDGRKLPKFSEYLWTKGDVIKYFELGSNKEIMNSPTIASGTFFIKKYKKTEKMIEEWLDVIKYDFSLIDDSPSKNQNPQGFIKPGHDQSIFSILSKINKIDVVSYFECWYPKKNCWWPNLPVEDWGILGKYPIHGKRDKVLSSTKTYL